MQKDMCRWFVVEAVEVRRCSWPHGHGVFGGLEGRGCVVSGEMGFRRGRPMLYLLNKVVIIATQPSLRRP